MRSLQLRLGLLDALTAAGANTTIEARVRVYEKPTTAKGEGQRPK